MPAIYLIAGDPYTELQIQIGSTTSEFFLPAIYLIAGAGGNNLGATGRRFILAQPVVTGVRKGASEIRSFVQFFTVAGHLSCKIFHLMHQRCQGFFVFFYKGSW